MVKIKQKGSAVLLALVFFVLISGLCSDMIKGRVRQVQVMKTTQDFTDRSELLLGGESWAKTWLLGNNEPDSYGTPILVNKSFALDGGEELGIHLFDMQSCINVNTLNNAQFESITRGRLSRLSSLIGADNKWIEVLSDWLDPDSKGRYEDAAYADKGYKVANTSMIDMSEWNLLDVPEKDKTALMPFLCALPKDQTKMDINAITRAEMPVFFPAASADTLDYLAGIIASHQVANINSLLNNPALSSLDLNVNDWTARPHIVEVLVKLTKDKQEFWLNTKLAITNGRVNSFYRSFDTPSKSVLKRFGLDG